MNYRIPFETEHTFIDELHQQRTGKVALVWKSIIAIEEFLYQDAKEWKRSPKSVIITDFGKSYYVFEEFEEVCEHWTIFKRDADIMLTNN